MNGLNDIVGQDAKEAGRWFSRDNLLINAYWGNKASIVNQQGKDEYVGKGYSIDGWRLWSNTNTLSIADDGIIGDGWLAQMLDYGRIEPGVYTLSALVASGKINYLHLYPAFGNALVDCGGGLYTITGNLSKEKIVAGLRAAINFGTGCKAIAAKLEKGPDQTLAHKENGVWVQNRTTRYEDELRRCKWYQLVFKEWRQAFALFVCRAANSCTAIIPVDELRIVPTVTFFGNFRAITPTKAINFSEPLTTTLIHGRKGFVAVDMNPIKGLEAGDVGWLDIGDNDSYVLLNSNP